MMGVLLSTARAEVMLTALRLLFDYSEAQKNRAERLAAARHEERIRELERQVAELKAAR